MRTLIALLFGLLGTVATANAKDQGGIMSFGKQTICLGRFLVDIPKEAYKVADSSNYRGRSVSVRAMKRDDYLKLVSDKETNLSTTKHENEPSLLKQLVKSADGDNATFIYRESSTDAYQYNVEAFKWMNNRSFILKSRVDDDRVNVSLQNSSKTLAELQYRRPDAIPASAGFCIDSGFFAGDPPWPHLEKTFVHLRFKNNPDVMVTISTDVNTDKLDKGLLARTEKRSIPDAYKELAKRVKSMRRGLHPVGNIHGEETLDSVPGGEIYDVHMFYWEAPGKPRDIYAPSIVVNLETGETLDSEKQRPSLSDKQAIELFDSIVNSIRLRPTGGTGAADTLPPPPRPPAKTPLGTRLPSGSMCPQTGEWVCEQQQAMGGARRVFAEGEPLPEVLLPVRLNAWQKLLGKPDKRPAATVWTLASLPENRS